jgi:hypothetical protein
MSKDHLSEIHLVRVKPTITLELDSSGQIVTIDLQEAKAIIKSLAKFVDQSQGRTVADMTSSKGAQVSKRRGRSTKAKPSQKGPSMSENKRQEIIDHIQKQLSARPKTLSALLKGVSYVPNYLPAIREMVESRGSINREIIGRRVYYSRKASAPATSHKTRTNAATP